MTSMTRDEAIVALQSVGDAEVEGARHAVEGALASSELSHIPVYLPNSALRICFRALAALTREPVLVEAYDQLQSDRSNLLCEREQWQAAERRVRELCASDSPPGSMAEEMNGYRTITVKQVLTALDAKEPA